MNPNIYVKENYELLRKILEDYKVTNTNNIYVVTRAFHYKYGFEVPFDSYYDIGSRVYTNIEDKSTVKAWISEQAYDKRTITSEFEKNNIVLNPYNTSKNNNGYENVRHEFFKNAIKYGQEKAKKLILSKYPRL